MAKKEATTDSGSKKTTRRSRRTATAPATILAACIGELDKLDDAERSQVLRSIHAYYGKSPTGLSYPPGVRSGDQQIVDEETRAPNGGRFA